MNVNELDIIVEHSLSSIQNLDTALSIHAAYDAIRHRVVSEAVTAIEAHLHTMPFDKELEIEDMGFKLNPIPGHSNLTMRLNTWPSNLSVRLSSDLAGAREVFIGVHDKLNGSDFREHLIDRLFPGGHSYASYGWQWWYYLEQPLRAWSNKAALLELRNPEVISKLAIDLEAIIKVLDDLLREQQHAPSTP